jgi:tetratricopeptide (TPR) repeat protein
LENISDWITQKAQIISKLNRDTNLSLLTAAKKYEDQNYSESAEILERHLEIFPSNTAAKILLSKTYARLGKYQQAVQHLKSASEIIHSPKTFDFYLKEIEEIQRGELAEIKSETANNLDLKITSEPISNIAAQTTDSKTYEHTLVSETLAKIYISQGELIEAIKIYEKLMERKPESKEKYLQSIEELRSRLEK